MEETNPHSQNKNISTWFLVVLILGIFVSFGLLLIRSDRLEIDHNQAEIELSKTISALDQPVILTDVSDVVDLVRPSIVTVAVNTTQTRGTEFFFGIPIRSEVEEVQLDIGTGFVVDGSGLVVTNKHVVSNLGQEYIVIDSNDREFLVTEIYRDPEHDLAFLQVEGLTAPALTLGDSGQLRVGQGVIAVGTALGEFRQTVTTGVVSGLGRTITASDGRGRQMETIQELIQTDAAINSGNSGGPLLDHTGRVIGVNVAVTMGAQNIGFAIPISVVSESLEIFETTGRFERPHLGVGFQMIGEQLATEYEIPQGAFIAFVQENSAAEAAGLQEGDIIINFGGETLEEGTLLTTLINRRKVGEEVELEYYRSGERRITTAILGTIPQP
ncbi:MAG: trypsin-like peptidase domain-containing protein [Pseudomonadales bacterium]|jgi:serine protease Do|nr:trypsin-like peptidase domain-containing protein [Pseudomonadales bacterium]